MRSAWALGAVAAVLLGTVVAPGIAFACSPRACTPAIAVPADGGTVPANVGALVFVPSRDLRASGQSPTTGEFELLGPDGAGVAVSFKPEGNGFLVMPRAPLTPGGRYRMRFPGGCGTPAVVEQAFTAGAETPRPLTVGRAAVTGHRVDKISVWTVSGSCTSEITAAIARVSVTPTPELRAYLAVAGVGASIDGKPAPTMAVTRVGSSETVDLDIYAGCVVNDKGAERGLTPGRYKVQINAHVAGEPVDPLPIWTDIELNCSGSASGGCSWVRGRPDEGAGLLGLLVAALALLRRRRCAGAE